MPRASLGKQTPKSVSGLALDLSPMVGTVNAGAETLPYLVKFAQAHDWGRGAFLSADGKMLHGLVERVMSPSGELTEQMISLPATWDVIKRWAGY